jgi:hypothetical protein
MKFFFVVAVSFLTFSVFGQQYVSCYKNADGKIYWQHQIDSLESHGNFIGIRGEKQKHDTTEISIFFYDKSKYQEIGLYCGNRKRLPRSDIKKLFPYNQTSAIQLVSFKAGSEGQRPGLPKKNSEIDKSKLFEVKTLDKQLENQLLDVLVNFATAGDSQSDGYIMMCYDPRNAILFLDDQKRVVGYVEICFDCRQTEIKPDKMVIGQFCIEKFAIIKDIFQKSDIKYGVRYIEQPATFPGGMTAQMEYFRNHKYSERLAKFNGNVILEFLVHQDGTTSDFKILRSLSEDCDKDAIAFIKAIPKWIPAISYDNQSTESTKVLVLPYHTK